MGGYGGVFLKVENSEKSENIRVGGYGGGVLKVENSEKSENIRVGGYGGGVSEPRKYLKKSKIYGWGRICGGIRVGHVGRYGGVVRWGGTLFEMSHC